MNDLAGVKPGPDTSLVELSADIVSAYISHNALSSSDLPRLIADVHSALIGLSAGAAPTPVEELKPAVPVRKSVTPDYIVCLEDGKKFKSLKRHLRTQFDMSPEQYREKWGLPADYPMVAPNYSATRSRLATDNGLGRKPGAGRGARSRTRQAVTA
jgi:predicted transcriptional regulator